MYAANPINWPTLRWLKASLQNLIAGYQDTLHPSERTMLAETLREIGEDYPQHQNYAAYLSSQIIGLSSQSLWLPSSRGSFQGRVFEAEHQRLQRQDQQLWWELSNFLGQFEEHPRRGIIEVVSSLETVEGNLRRILKEVEEGNVLALPAFLRLTGRPPNVVTPGIRYVCETHKQYLHWGAYPKMQCPQTIWKSGEELGKSGFGNYIPSNASCRIRLDLDPHFLHNMLSWMGDPDNLFALKKREFQTPTTPQRLLHRLFELHKHQPAMLLFHKEIEDHFTGFLSRAVQVIAELNIPPKIPDWPIVPISWSEIVQLTNLRTDLIDGLPFAQRWSKVSQYSRKMGFLIENMSPVAILTFSVVEPYQNRQPPSYWVTRLSHGICIEEYSKDPVAPLRFATFG